MSSSLTVYVGTYLECQNKTEKFNITGKVCCRKVYNKYDIFCSVCATKLKESVTDTKERKIIEPYDLIDDVKEKIRPLSLYLTKKDNIDIWISNYQYRSIKDAENLRDDECLVDLSKEETITNDFNDFMTEFEKEIEILRNAYRSDNVKIKFGVISYYD